MATRQELEKNLPEASKFLLDYVWQLCLEARINVPQQDLLLIGRMVSAYFTTERGKMSAIKLLNADVGQASPLKSYYKAGFLNDPSERIQQKDLWEFKGWLLRRGDKMLTLKHGSIDCDDREDSTICEACGGKFPADFCTKNIEVFKNNGVQRVETWCNHCRQHSEQPRVRETGSAARCQECPKLICEFHPKHNELVARSVTRSSVVALLPPGQSTGMSNIPANVPLPPGWTR